MLLRASFCVAQSILLRAEERVAAWTGVQWEDFTGFQVGAHIMMRLWLTLAGQRNHHNSTTHKTLSRYLESFASSQVRDEWEHVPASGVPVSVLASKPPCSPVHVDNHKAPARVSTSIIYLTTLSSGATVFPCILPEGTKKSVVKHTEMITNAIIASP